MSTQSHSVDSRARQAVSPARRAMNHVLRGMNHAVSGPNFLILVAVCCLILPSQLHAQTTQPSRFIRVVQDPAPVQPPATGSPAPRSLQTSITTYRHPSGATVDLIAMVHVGQASYYRTVAERLAGCDTVLYEYVGEPRSRGGPVPDQAIAQQTTQFDYRAPNMQRADMDPADFRARAIPREEKSPALTPAPVPTDSFPAAQSAGAISADVQNPTYLSSLIQALPDLDNPLVLEALDRHFLLHDRNRIAIDALTHRLARGDTHLALLYGAAHAPELDQLLQRDLGFVPQPRVEWLTVWTQPTSAP